MKTTQAQRDHWRSTIPGSGLCTSHELALLDDADRCAKLETALRSIIDTDTHGKNEPDENGQLRPTGRDFCGRCNRNSFHPHADDCPISLARAALKETR